MLPWFDRFREAQIRAKERSYPRIVRSLRDVDAAYLLSVPGADYFLRRDRSVWMAVRPGWSDDGPVEWQAMSERDRIGALTAAIRIRRLRELAELLPARPPDAVDCPGCTGRDLVLGFLVCGQCLGLGWITAPDS